MDYLRLALKNILRRRLRSLLSVLGVAAAVAVLYSLLEFQRGYERGLNQELEQLGAHIMVVPKGCPYEAATIVLHGGKWPRYMDEEYFDRIAATPGVGDAAPILMDAIIDPQGRDSRIFLGITDEYPALRSRWELVAGTGFSGPAAREVILGSTMAERLRLSPGDTFALRQDAAGRAGGKQDADLRVAGVLARTGTQDDGLIFLPLATVQELFNLPGRIVVVLVRAERLDSGAIEQLSDDLRALGGNMNIFPLTELVENAAQLVQATRVFVWAIAAVAIAVSAAGVLNTILMAVFERRKEIGMMKAVGAGRKDVFALVWAETVLICLGGGLLGVSAALLGSRATEWFLRATLSSQFAALPRTTLIGFSPPLAALCLVVATLVGMIAGSYPAWRAGAVRPIEAIRGAD